jgi:hypothetical protein
MLFLLLDLRQVFPEDPLSLGDVLSIEAFIGDAGLVARRLWDWTRSSRSAKREPSIALE